MEHGYNMGLRKKAIQAYASNCFLVQIGEIIKHVSTSFLNHKRG